MSKVIVHVSGGLVQRAYLVRERFSILNVLKDFFAIDPPSPDLIILDSDVEGSFDDDLTSVSNGKEIMHSHIHLEELINLPDGCEIDMLYKQWVKDESKQ